VPPINAAAFPDNQVAQFFARNQSAAAGGKPQPLYTPDGKSLLLDAFAAIDTKYGSVDAYLEKEVGVTAADIAPPAGVGPPVVEVKGSSATSPPTPSFRSPISTL
jgi:beta-lactamase class A